MRLFSALAVSLLPTALAVFQDEAGEVDYHHALLGLPQRHTTFFHQPQPSSKASLVYSLSELHILGAINPKDGSLVWRQRLQPGLNSNASFLFPGHSQSIVSGVDGHIACWTAIDGKLIWSVEQDLPGTLVDLNSLDIGPLGHDVAALFQGESITVQRLDGKNGSPIWQYKDTSSDTPLKVVNSATKVYYISLSGSIRHGQKIKVTVLDSRNGQKLDQVTLSSESDVESSKDVHVEIRSQFPVLIWADKAMKTLKVNVLGSKTITNFPILNESTRDLTTDIALHSANDISAPTHVLVEYRSRLAHWGVVLHVESEASSKEADPSKAKVKKAYDVGRLAGQGTIAPSLTDGKLFFTRVAKGVFIVLASAENEVIESNIMRDFGVPGIVDYPEPTLSVGEISPRTDGKTFAVRTVTLLATGDFVLISNGNGSWTRHEGLAYIVSADFADLPLKQSLAQQLAIEDHASMVSAYIHRLKRHINDLKQLPKYIEELPVKVLSSITGTTVDQKGKDDLFGFHKYVIVLTKQKRLMALDVANHGKVVWSNNVFGWKSDNIPEMTVSPLGVVRVKSDDDHSVFNITTGQFMRNFQRKEAEPPKSKSSSQPTVRYTLEENQLLGRTPDSTTPVWTFKPRAGEEIVSLTTRLDDEPVASIGDALGDRRVLYKYLNPNIVLVTAVSAAKHTASFYLLDGVSGNTLHATTHNDVDTTQPLPTVLSENWLAYSFSIFPSTKAPSRGYQLVMAKLFESALPDDRGPLGATTNFSSFGANSAKAMHPHVLAQNFHLSEPIAHLAVTQTRQGITTRQLLAVLPQSAALAAIPLGALDPRRPVGREPSKVEAEEGLVRYAPSLVLDPKWFLSHRREVLGLAKVRAAPATLESTSLLFAWGLGGDVFGTRVAPSFAFDVLGKEFNRVQMLITVGAVIVAVMVLAPIVARKGNNVRWEIL